MIKESKFEFHCDYGREGIRWILPAVSSKLELSEVYSIYMWKITEGQRL